MSNTVLITLMVSLTVMISLGAVAYAFFSPAIANRDRASRRIKSISQGEQVAAVTGTVDANKAKDRRKDIQEKMKELENKKKGNKKRLTLRNRIDQAGLDIQPASFYISSLIFGTFVGLMVWLSGQSMITVGASFFVGCTGLPLWFLSFLASRRQKAFTNELANAVDIIVRGVKSGLPINECLQIIANESPDPVGTEFRDLVDNMRVGMPMEQALQRFYERMPLAEVNFFVIVLSIQQKAGGNLSEALGNLSGVLRSRKLMKEKIKTMSSEAKASTIIIGSLPPGVMAMIHLTTPSYMEILFESLTGNILIGLSLFWMSCGLFIMKKMVSFKF